MLLNVRSGVQHLADKLDFVDGKGAPESSDDLAEERDIVQQINHILTRSGDRIDNLITSLGDEVRTLFTELAISGLAILSGTHISDDFLIRPLMQLIGP